jgi:hypothetical protein
LLARLTSSELTEWMAYMMIEEQDREAERKKAQRPHGRQHKR